MKVGRPRVAIIDPNTLAVLGLKQILQNVMPIMTVETFNSFEELQQAQADDFVHYFVAVNEVLESEPFFFERRHRTIVLTTSHNPNTQLSRFHSLCINVPKINWCVLSLLLNRLRTPTARIFLRFRALCVPRF